MVVTTVRGGPWTRPRPRPHSWPAASPLMQKQRDHSGGSRACTARHWNFELLAQRIFQLVANIRVFLEEYARILAALAHAFPAEADPRAALLEHALFDAQINQVALARNAFA